MASSGDMLLCLFGLQMSSWSALSAAQPDNSLMTQSGGALMLRRLIAPLLKLAFYHFYSNVWTKSQKWCSIERMILILWCNCVLRVVTSVDPDPALHPLHTHTHTHTRSSTWAVPSHYHLMTEASLIKHIFTPHYYERKHHYNNNCIGQEWKCAWKDFKECRCVEVSFIKCKQILMFIMSKWWQNLDVVYFLLEHNFDSQRILLFLRIMSMKVIFFMAG